MTKLTILSKPTRSSVPPQVANLVNLGRGCTRGRTRCSCPKSSQLTLYRRFQLLSLVRGGHLMTIFAPLAIWALTDLEKATLATTRSRRRGPRSRTATPTGRTRRSTRPLGPRTTSRARREATASRSSTRATSPGPTSLLRTPPRLHPISTAAPLTTLGTRDSRIERMTPVFHPNFTIRTLILYFQLAVNQI